MLTGALQTLQRWRRSAQQAQQAHPGAVWATQPSMQRVSHAEALTVGNLTAVCVVGEQRTFLEPVVQLGFARRLHRPGYEYFVVTDQRRPRSELPERRRLSR